MDRAGHRFLEVDHPRLHAEVFVPLENAPAMGDLEDERRAVARVAEVHGAADAGGDTGGQQPLLQAVPAEGALAGAPQQRQALRPAAEVAAVFLEAALLISLPGGRVVRVSDGAVHVDQPPGAGARGRLRIRPLQPLMIELDDPVRPLRDHARRHGPRAGRVIALQAIDRFEDHVGARADGQLLLDHAPVEPARPGGHPRLAGDRAGVATAALSRIHHHHPRRRAPARQRPLQILLHPDQRRPGRFGQRRRDLRRFGASRFQRRQRQPRHGRARACSSQRREKGAPPVLRLPLPLPIRF